MVYMFQLAKSRSISGRSSTTVCLGLPPSQARAGGPGKSDPGTFHFLMGRVDDGRLIREDILVVPTVTLED